MRYRDVLPYAVEETGNIWIPLSDGARLAARLWLPEGADTSPVPAILEYIPYRKGDRTAIQDSAIHRYFAGHGYASLRVDMRGSGESDGVLNGEYLQQELDDGCEVLRWIAAQAWCSGKVGIVGLSWGGFNGLQIAAMRPPELGAVISVCSTDDRYSDDVHHMGGCLLTDNLAWSATMFARNSLPPDPEVVGARWREMWVRRLDEGHFWLETWLQHQRRDAFWKHGSVCENFGAIEAPVYAVSGWADGYSDAVLRLLENLKAPCKGLIGPWSHNYPHAAQPGPAIGFLQECLRWWDHWLMGERTGIMDEPALRVWMQDSVAPATRYEIRPGRWVGEPTWPSPNIEWRGVSLAPGRLVSDAGDGARSTGDSGGTPLTIRSPLSVGLYGGKWCPYSRAPDLPYDQRLDDGGALVFDSAPLKENVEILGGPELELELAADRAVAMIAVRLSDIDPDGAVTRVTYALLNLTHRDGHEEPKELVPGQRTRVGLRLHDIAHVFPEGHCMRLAISTSYWPMAWPAPQPVRLSIWPETCRLMLPLRAPRAEDIDLRIFEEPEAAVPDAHELLEEPFHNWWVTHDLDKDEVRLEVHQDGGARRLQEKDLTVREINQECYSFRHNDNETVRGETTFHRELSRDGWNVRTVTHAVLTSDAATFHVQAHLTAYEGEQRVFSKSWRRSIARDLV